MTREEFENLSIQDYFDFVEECKKEFFTEFCKMNGDPKNMKLVEFECLGFYRFKATIRRGNNEDWYNVRRLGHKSYEWS